MGQRAKIVFQLDRTEFPYATETVWAEHLSDKRFRILNSPFFAFGISYEDEVEAEPDGEVFQFVRVLRRSGRSTYRVILQGGRTIEHPDFSSRWATFREHGCTFESVNESYIAIDIPPNVDIKQLYRHLQGGECDGVWVFEEGHYAGNG